MKAYEVFDVYVEDVVALDGENGGLNIVVFHVYSGGVCAPHVFDVGLVFHMNSGFDVVSYGETDA